MRFWSLFRGNAPRVIAAAGAVVIASGVWIGASRAQTETSVVAAPAVFAGSAPVKPPALAPLTEVRPDSGMELIIESATKPATPDQAPAKDAHRSRTLALYVPAGVAPSAYVPAGPFKATFKGIINLRIRGEYTFSAEGTGGLKITINDAPVYSATGPDLTCAPAGTPAKLNKGGNTIVAEYTSPPDGGDASVRILWSERKRPAEPVPPTLLTFDASDADYRGIQRERDGRELFVSARCTKCHAPANSALSAEYAMAELAMDAPSLDGAGSRLNAPWMARWIANPKEMRSDATMPKIFHEQPEEKAKDLAAYLATLTSTDEVHKLSDVVNDPAQVGAGGRIFTGLGCINCHVPPDQEIPPPPTSTGAFVKVPLKFVNAKYKPEALFAFLKKPEAHYAWIRMPNFKLSDLEAEQLIAFLTARAPKDAIPADAAAAGDVERGKTLFTESGCLNCHAGPQELKNDNKPPMLADLLKSDWTKGCVANDEADRGKAPDFSLSDDQRASLMAFAASDWASLHRDNPAEFSERQVAVLNCTACHTLDKQDDDWTARDEEIAAYEKTLPELTSAEKTEAEHLAPDQSRPLLTWIGEKLRPEWAEKFIAGKVDYKPRSWLRARMPAFPARAEGLAKGLAEQHGFPPKSIEPAPADPELASIGQKLSGKAGGFSCNQCHAIGPAPALAAFEAPAPNFSHVKERLIKPFYDRWLRNPQRIQPGTRMPQFADGDGKTSLTDTFDGDAGKQFDAIWNYLLAGNDIQPPTN